MSARADTLVFIFVLLPVATFCTVAHSLSILHMYTMVHHVIM